MIDPRPRLGAALAALLLIGALPGCVLGDFGEMPSAEDLGAVDVSDTLGGDDVAAGGTDADGTDADGTDADGTDADGTDADGADAIASDVADAGPADDSGDTPSQVEPEPDVPSTDSTTVEDTADDDTAGEDTGPDSVDGPETDAPSSPDVGEDTTAADVSEPDTSEPDTSEPDPDVPEPDPDASEPDPDASEPDPDASEPDPDVSEPDPDVSEPDPDVSEPDPDVSEPDAMAPDDDTTDDIGPEIITPLDPIDDPDLDGLGPDDPCPTVWSPDGDPAPCSSTQPWEESLGRTLTLTPATSRRVREVIEVPLVNGLIDSQVAGYWRVDGHILGHVGEATLFAGAAIGYDTGVFGRPGGAIRVDGNAPGLVTDISFDGSPPYTVAAWVAPESDGTLWSGGEGLGTVRVWLAEGTLHADIGALHLSAAWPDGDPWHHIALAVVDERSLLFIDGEVAAATEDHPEFWGADGPQTLVFGADGEGGDALTGRLDELLVLDRMLPLADLRSYVLAHRPWGTPLVPGAAIDFTDVTVTAGTPFDDTVYAVPVERIGTMPHSHVPCPLDEDDGTFADRDDLCGVAWRNPLDGLGAEPVAGRFGEPEGALDLDWEGSDAALGFVQTGEEQTWEMWLQPEPCPSDETATVLEMKPPGEGGPVGILSIGTACTFGVPGVPLANGTFAAGDWWRWGQWLHVAVVSSTQADATWVYVDGEEVGSVPGALPPTSAPLVARATGYVTLDDLLLHDVAKSPAYLRRRGQRRTPSLRFLASTDVTPSEAGSWDWHDYVLRWGEGVGPVGPAVLHAPDGTPSVGLIGPATGVVGSWHMEAHAPTVAVDYGVFGRDGVVDSGAAGTGGGALVTTANNLLTMPEWAPGEPRTVELLWQPRDADLFTLASEGDAWSLFVQSPDVVLTGGDGVGFAPTAGDARGLTAVHFHADGVTLAGGADGEPVDVAFGPPPGGSGALALGGDSSPAIELYRVRVTEGRNLDPAEQLPVTPAAWTLGTTLWPDGPPDSDGDGVPDDGDGFGVAGDFPCAGGQTEGCDDNCVLDNADQADGDGDGVPDACAVGPPTVPECTLDEHCDDGDGCTWGDGCDLAEGTCLETFEYDCDDGELCTVDSCSPAGGCTHTDLGDCDPDGDGVGDLPDVSPCVGAPEDDSSCSDNCALSNPTQADFNGDGVGDACLAVGLATWLRFGVTTEDTVLHGPLAGVPGHRGGALSFDGAGYLETPLTPAWFPDEAVAFTGWAQTTGDGPPGAVMGYTQYPAGNPQWFLHRWDEDDWLTRYLHAEEDFVEQSLPLLVDTWQLLITAWENVPDAFGHFVAGALPGEANYNYTTKPFEEPGFYEFSDPLIIGAQSGITGPHFHFTGLIDDVAFYDQMVTQPVFAGELFVDGAVDSPLEASIPAVYYNDMDVLSDSLSLAGAPWHDIEVLGSPVQALADGPSAFAGSAVCLDEDADLVILSSGDDALTDPAGFTLAFWVMEDQAQQDGILMRTQEETPWLAIGRSAGNMAVLIAGQELTVALDAGWHHMVVRVDRVAEEVEVWIDGEQGNGTSLDPGLPEEGFLVLGDPNGGWRGCLDELGQWTRPLTNGELETLYMGGVGWLLP